ncbi:heptaprenyl diphosphate synthase component 1 [Sporolactobacillus shoreicorticis]|uniref:Heptaprenyl diphosphate synthase component 1 n=1 Tax=Sporolactobacillus shoreicorticis TaxID=1923877 RepID=A0ABW5RZZ5_9BACL|nr:heptaprenyl diphosphate synthase component 1 [Sporolactobacillus shoreicorticis]MCO7127036.1 heptaprenyl diphosphate synthase component 1 [Sporolactobacillus shoreicorticis]
MSLNEELELVYQQLRNELNHDYVKTILPEPVIDRDKLMIYYLLFRRQESRANAGVYAKSVMVAEIGLNTHEMITVEKRSDMNAIKMRQLTVLSGDFYSALYYYTLARQSNMEVVKWVAQAIQTFNLHKFAFFYSETRLSWPETIEIVMKIESALVEKLARQLGFARIVPYLNAYFLIKRLVIERKNHGKSERDSYFSQTIQGRFEKVTDRLDQEIKNKVAHLTHILNRQENHSEWLIQVIDYLRDQLSRLAEGVEEGTY